MIMPVVLPILRSAPRITTTNVGPRLQHGIYGERRQNGSGPKAQPPEALPRLSRSPSEGGSLSYTGAIGYGWLAILPLIAEGRERSVIWLPGVTFRFWRMQAAGRWRWCCGVESRGRSLIRPLRVTFRSSAGVGASVRSGGSQSGDEHGDAGGVGFVFGEGGAEDAFFVFHAAELEHRLEEAECDGGDRPVEHDDAEGGDGFGDVERVADARIGPAGDEFAGGGHDGERAAEEVQAVDRQDRAGGDEGGSDDTGGDAGLGAGQDGEEDQDEGAGDGGDARLQAGGGGAGGQAADRHDDDDGDEHQGDAAGDDFEPPVFRPAVLGEHGGEGEELFVAHVGEGEDEQALAEQILGAFGNHGAAPILKTAGTETGNWRNRGRDGAAAKVPAAERR